MSAWVPEHDKRQLKASAKVTDAMNTSKPGLKLPPQSTSAKRKQSVSVHAVEDQDLHAVLQGIQ